MSEYRINGEWLPRASAADLPRVWIVPVRPLFVPRLASESVFNPNAHSYRRKYFEKQWCEGVCYWVQIGPKEGQ